MMITKLLSLLSLALTATNAVDCTTANHWDLTDLTSANVGAFASLSKAGVFTKECPEILVTIYESWHNLIRNQLGNINIVSAEEVATAVQDNDADRLLTTDNVPFALTLAILVGTRRRRLITETVTITTYLNAQGQAGSEYTLNIDVTAAVPANLVCASNTENLIDLVNTPALALDGAESIVAVDIYLPSTIVLETDVCYAFDKAVDSTSAKANTLAAIKVIEVYQWNDATSSYSDCNGALFSIATDGGLSDYTFTITLCDCSVDISSNGCSLTEAPVVTEPDTTPEATEAATTEAATEADTTEADSDTTAAAAEEGTTAAGEGDATTGDGVDDIMTTASAGGVGMMFASLMVVVMGFMTI